MTAPVSEIFDPSTWTEVAGFDFTDITYHRANHIGAVLVMDRDQLVGILSERDYTRAAVEQGHAASDTQVREIMTARPVCVGPEQTIEECMALMTEKRVRHLPVVEDGQVEGIVSIGDLVKAVISDQKFIIEQLENYITGWPELPQDQEA